jgi:hypothetical protein
MAPWTRVQSRFKVDLAMAPETSGSVGKKNPHRQISQEHGGKEQAKR